MDNEELTEEETREKAIARLNIASFAIDISIIGLVFAFILPSVMRLPFRTYVGEENLALAEVSMPFMSLAIILFLYFQVSEYFGFSASLGRVISGLNLLDAKTRRRPQIKARRNRLKRQIRTLGLPTLNPNRVAAYNRSDECCMYSDWLGSPATDTKDQARKDNRSRSQGSKIQNVVRLAPKGVVSVISGANSGETININRALEQQQYFVIGRGNGVDLQLAGDQSISNKHCHIQCYKGEYIIQDGMPKQKGSSFGTNLNDYKIPTDKYMRLKPKDKICLGDSTVLEFL